MLANPRSPAPGPLPSLCNVPAAAWQPVIRRPRRTSEHAGACMCANPSPLKVYTARYCAAEAGQMRLQSNPLGPATAAHRKPPARGLSLAADLSRPVDCTTHPISVLSDTTYCPDNLRRACMPCTPRVTCRAAWTGRACVCAGMAVPIAGPAAPSCKGAFAFIALYIACLPVA